MVICLVEYQWGYNYIKKLFHDPYFRRFDTELLMQDRATIRVTRSGSNTKENKQENEKNIKWVK